MNLAKSGKGPRGDKRARHPFQRIGEKKREFTGGSCDSAGSMSPGKQATPLMKFLRRNKQPELRTVFVDEWGERETSAHVSEGGVRGCDLYYGAAESGDARLGWMMRRGVTAGGIRGQLG